MNYLFSITNVTYILYIFFFSAYCKRIIMRDVRIYIKKFTIILEKHHWRVTFIKINVKYNVCQESR